MTQPIKPKSDPSRRMDPHSAAYRRAAITLALTHAPPIYPCKRCGRPVLDGYLCHCGSSADHGYEQFMG